MEENNTSSHECKFWLPLKVIFFLLNWLWWSIGTWITQQNLPSYFIPFKMWAWFNIAFGYYFKIENIDNWTYRIICFHTLFILKHSKQRISQHETIRYKPQNHVFSPHLVLQSYKPYTFNFVLQQKHTAIFFIYISWLFYYKILTNNLYNYWNYICYGEIT
jgi:hypothetical protein